MANSTEQGIVAQLTRLSLSAHPPAAHLWLQWSHFTFGLRHKHHHGHWICSQRTVNKVCLTRSIKIIIKEKLLPYSVFFFLLVLNSLHSFMETLQVCQSYRLPPKCAKGSLVRGYGVCVEEDSLPSACPPWWPLNTCCSYGIEQCKGCLLLCPQQED